MTPFARIFEIEGSQVVAYRDFENNDDGTTTYRIVTLVEAQGGAQSISYGYADEAKRDAKWAEFDERGARVSLNAVRELVTE